MPRRRPGWVRVDAAARVRSRGGGSETSAFPGLSPYGRVVLARLEWGRLWPGAVAEALKNWEWFVREPDCVLGDSSYGRCGIWGCCPTVDEVVEVLVMAEHALPRLDARRLRRRLGDSW